MTRTIENRITYNLQILLQSLGKDGRIVFLKTIHRALGFGYVKILKLLLAYFCLPLGGGGKRGTLPPLPVFTEFADRRLSPVSCFLLFPGMDIENVCPSFNE